MGLCCFEQTDQPTVRVLNQMVLVGRTKIAGEEGMQLQLGKYEIGRTLGEGNFGKVKYAKDLQTGHPFAVKILEKTRIKNLNFSDQVLFQSLGLRLSGF